MKRALLAVVLLLAAGGWMAQDRAQVVTGEGVVGGDRERFLLEQGYRRVPMMALPTGHYSVAGSAGDVSLALIVDTGASHTVIDLERAERFGLQSEYRGRQATGIGAGSQRVETGDLEGVILGAARLETLRVTVMDLSPVNGVLRRMGTEPVDGMIGSDVLLAREAVIDYGAAALYLKD